MTHLISDLRWVDFDFVCSNVCLILLGLMRDRQMGTAVRQDDWIIQINVMPTQIRDLLCLPV